VNGHRRQQRPSARFAWWPVLLAAAAMIVFWSATWHRLDQTALTRVPVLDEAYYLRRGAAIAGGERVPRQPFYMSPLYPYLVAVTGSGRTLDAHRVRVGPPPTGIRILQAACWAWVAVLLGVLGRRFLDRRLWWLPPALWLLYRPAAVLVTTVLLEIPLTAVVTGLLALLTLPRGPAGLRRAALAGLLIGLAGLLRGHTLLLWLPAAWALRDPAAATVWRRWRGALLAGVVAAGMLLPAVVVNSVRSGRPVGPSLNGGINLYIGNGPEANGLFITFTGFDVEADPTGAAFLSRRLGRHVPDAAAADRTWAREAWRSIRARPGRALRLWLRKVHLHLTAAEFPQISPLEAWPRYAPTLRPLVVPYGLLSAGGLVGLVLALRRRRRWVLVWIAAATLLVAGGSVFFVVSRYRLVLVPVWALLTGLAAGEVLAAGRRERLLALGLLVAAVLVVQPWGLRPLLVRLQAAGLVNEAIRWQHLGDAGRTAADPAATADLQRAARLYEHALELDPRLTQAYRGLARLRVLQGREQEAVAVLRRGLERALERPLVEKDLINLLLQRREIDRAIPLLDDYLRRDSDPTLLHNYTVALLHAGRPAAAEQAARRLLDEHPGDPRGYLDLGILLARAGRLPEAAAVLRRGLGVAPADTSLAGNLRRVERLLGLDRSGGPR